MMKTRIKPLYLQIVFTLLAFTMMVILSYTFNSRTVRENLRRNADSVLSFTYEQIASELVSSKVLLGNFAQTVQLLLLDGHKEDLQHYITITSEYAMSDHSGLSNVNGLYGYFITIFDEPIYINGTNWLPPDDYNPPDRLWYKAAKQNCGEIMETEPYIDAITGQYIITFARCIQNREDACIGVVAIDIPLDKIGEIVINAALYDGGYGLLAAQDLTVISYANKDFIGRRMTEPELATSQFSNLIQQGENLFEQPMRNWRGERVIAFSRILPNGWHLVLLAPENLYYRGITRMIIVSCILGAILAAALIIVLVRIDRAKEKAGEESRQKSAFLANMSHEIRTPMNAIIGMTSIGKTAADVMRKDYCLEKIENASQHLLGVINDVLDMSKIEANMFELSCVEFNFEKMLTRVISITGFRAEEKKQKVLVDVDKSIPQTLVGDDQRLAQVITNLLGNAVKFTPEGGLIKLIAQFMGEENGLCNIQITVEDSGIGISEEQQKQLFRAFRQADSRISRKFGGSGLGLVISKNIVELMGGKMKLESELGKGSSFSFNFRARRGDGTTAESYLEEEKKCDNTGIFKGYKILLAEDVEINREIIITITEPTLLKIDCAENGIEAVEMFRKLPDDYDLILMDVQMPEMDGYEATLKIREIESERRKMPLENSKQSERPQHAAQLPAQGVPIVAMTANVFKEDIEKCLSVGMNNHVGKPIDVEEFFIILKKYLPKI